MLTLKEQTMLGNIPADWNSLPLADLLTAHYPGDWGDDGGPHMVKTLRSTNLTNTGKLDLSDVALRALPLATSVKLSPRKHDILLERSGGGPGQPVGRVGFVEADMPGSAFSNFLHLLRPDSTAIEPRFLGWVLHRVNSTGRIIRLEQQTTQMRNLHFRDYLTMRLPVPPPTEQAAIARILDAADTAIERTRAAVARARELDSALVHDLLERGVDDHGQLRSGGRADMLRTSVGLLPKAWQLSRVGDEFDLQNGFTLNEAVHTHGQKRRYLRVANVQRDELRLEDVQELYATDRAFAPRMLEVGDLLVVEGHADRMQIGRCARVTPEARGMTFQNHLFRLRSLGRATSEFSALWLNSDHARRYWNARCATSSGLNTINQRMLKKLDIPVPSKREQERIAELIGASRTKVGSLLAKESALTQLKKSLMHDLLTGRVRVGGLESGSVS